MDKQGKATSASELRRELLDPNLPKTEREHWAAHEIERLEKHHKIAVDNWTLEAQTVKQHEDELHELIAKIERLHAIIAELQDDKRSLARTVGRHEAAWDALGPALNSHIEADGMYVKSWDVMRVVNRLRPGAED